MVILGPTATGKTDLAIKLAKKFNGELVACDSRQVYRGLDVGTGKFPRGEKWEVRRGRDFWEIGEIRVWGYDIADPMLQYSVADYVKYTDGVIKEITDREKLPIIVGGTGLYLKALLEGLPNLSIPVNQKLRGELEKLTLLELQNKLKVLSPAKWKKLNGSDRQNPRRLLRAIEIVIMNPYMQIRQKSKGERQNYDVLKIGLTAPREILYKNADLRVLDWIDHGIIEEAKNLRKNDLTLKRMKQLGLEYGALADYLSGEIREIKGEKGLIKKMQNKIHGYIRRQQTWFKREKGVNWFDILSKHYINNVEMLLKSWYY